MNMHEILQKDPEIWDLFTRKEEYDPMVRDQYERFPFYASSCRNIFRPRASEYLMDNGFLVTYPEERPFAVCLTHDIDQVYTAVTPKITRVMQELRKGSFSGFTHSVLAMRSKKIPAWNFSDIMALEDRYGAKSSFYFLVLDPDEQDYTYRIEDCEPVLGDIIDRGFEAGLHGGHGSYLSPQELHGKKERLEKIVNCSVTGYRNHFLRFKVPETWEYLREAGFLYDTTLGYAECIGFRNGMCHPFRPYNRITGKSIDIVEIPLNIMEITFENHMNLDTTLSWDLTKQLIDTTARCHGVLTLLFHNVSFMRDQWKFYEKILKYCKEKNAWMTSGEEISTWWRDHVETG
jgi:peptidoglycan/xylan/chitin deacetylase (PgdA/CDA1 family)